MKKTVRITSTFLAILMLLALIGSMSIGVAATQTTTEQTNDYTGYYKIGNAGQLAWFACLVVGDTSQSGITEAVPNAKAVLTADIDITVLGTTMQKSWSGIGTAEIPFTGIFDGNGYTIKGLTIDSSLPKAAVATIPNTTTEQGLFGVIGTGGIVRNLVVEGTASVGDGQKLGAICSQNNGTIENVLSKITVEGGITPSAFCHTNNGTITNSYYTVVDTATGVTAVDATQPAVQKSFGANGAPLYEISNVGQLYWFVALVNTGAKIADMDTPTDTSDDLYTYHLNARLTANITVNPGNFEENGSYTAVNNEQPRMWVPLGNINYSGDFDGNYKTISGLYQFGSGPSHVGFIGKGKEGHVLRNLGITNSVFANGGYLGVFYAYQEGGKLQNCWTDAIVRGSESLAANTGGFAGKLYGTVENSFFAGAILKSSGEPMDHPYGVCGNQPADGVIVNSYATLGEGAWRIAAADLASGKLAALLANGDARSIWGQALGTDVYPVFLGPVVYANVPFNCTQVGYSNSPVGSTAHVPATDWSSDGEAHWHACTVEGCDEKLDVYAHAYDHACDDTCNICEVKRTVNHVYDNDCDSDCNICDFERSVAAHVDADGNNACDICEAFVEGGLSGGAGIAIGAGATAVVLLGGFAIFWFVIRKKKAK